LFIVMALSLMMYTSVTIAVLLASAFLHQRLGRRVTLLALVLVAIMMAIDNYRPVHLVDRPIMAVKAQNYYQSIAVSIYGKRIWLNIPGHADVGCYFSGRLEWLPRRGEVVHGNISARMRGASFYPRVKEYSLSCDDAVGSSVSYPLVFALYSGDLSFVPKSLVNKLVDSNLIHLFVVSGLHLGLLILLLKRFRQLALGPLFTILALSVVLYYLSLINIGPSAIRVLCFALVCVYAMLYRVQYSLIQSLLLSFVLGILISPSDFWSLGFWMSYGAVAIIFGTIQGARGCSAFAALCLQYLLALFSYVMVFGRINLLKSLGANALLVSLWPFIYPMVLASSLLDLDILLFYLEMFLRQIIDVFSSRETDIFSSNNYLLRGLIVAYLLFLPAMNFGVRVVFALALLQLSFVRDEDTLVDIIDVGQGSSILISSGPSGILIDLANGDDSYAIYTKTIKPLLRYRGVSNVSYVTSHNDSDHSGGKLWAERDLSARGLIQPRSEHCVRGQHWSLGIAEINVLWPPLRRYRTYENSHSCVFEIRLGAHKILVMGDGTIQDELELIETFGISRYDALVVGHHGSLTSTSWALLAQVDTPLALISAGPRSRFGHPHVHTLQKLSHFGMKVLVTHEVGTITLHNDNGKLAASPVCDDLLANNNWC